MPSRPFPRNVGLGLQFADDAIALDAGVLVQMLLCAPNGGKGGRRGCESHAQAHAPCRRRSAAFSRRPSLGFATRNRRPKDAQVLWMYGRTLLQQRMRVLAGSATRRAPAE
ncbi:hypothetical protein MRX96_043031 [Rhipicephalus microplus]